MLLSTQEYDCLVAKFKDVTTAAQAIPDVQAKLQVTKHAILLSMHIQLRALMFVCT